MFGFLNKFFHGNENLVGLDIGSHSVKVVELRENRKGGLFLENLAICPMPAETIVDGTVMNSSNIVETIGRIWDQYRIRNKNVAVSLSGASVITKCLDLPAQSNEELAESIIHEMNYSNLIPFEIADVRWDYCPMETGVDGRRDVIIAVAKQDVIGDYESSVREAGLNVHVIDLDCFVIQNIFERVGAGGGGFDSNEHTVLVNVGASKVNMSIVSGNGTPKFTRDVNGAGNQLTNEIVKLLNVGFDEAESLKVGGQQEEGEADSMIPEAVLKIMAQAVDSIIMEIKRTLEFRSAMSLIDSSNAKIYLTGGSAQIPMFPKLLSEKSNLAVEIFNPFQDVGFDQKKFVADDLAKYAPFFSVAMGLALRRIGDIDR